MSDTHGDQLFSRQYTCSGHQPHALPAKPRDHWWAACDRLMCFSRSPADQRGVILNVVFATGLHASPMASNYNRHPRGRRRCWCRGAWPSVQAGSSGRTAAPTLSRSRVLRYLSTGNEPRTWLWVAGFVGHSLVSTLFALPRSGPAGEGAGPGILGCCGWVFWSPWSGCQRLPTCPHTAAPRSGGAACGLGPGHPWQGELGLDECSALASGCVIPPAATALMRLLRFGMPVNEQRDAFYPEPAAPVP